MKLKVTKNEGKGYDHIPHDEEDSTISSPSSSSSSAKNDKQDEVPSREKSFWYTFFISCNASRHLFIINLVSIIGYCCTISIVPEVLTQQYAIINHGYDNDSNCASFDSDNKPQECIDGSNDAQNATAMCSLISSIITFIFASVIGRVSDKYGRRIFLLSGIMLSIASPIVLVLLQVSNTATIHPNWYFVAQSMQGFISWFTIALSSISDVMPYELRAPAFGLVNSAFLLGFSIAPSFSLILNNHLEVSIMSVLILVFVLAYAYVFFPETLITSHDTCSGIGDDCSLQEESDDHNKRYNKLLDILKTPFKDLSILLRSQYIINLAIIAIFSTLAASVSYTFLLYYLEQDLDFDDKDISTLFIINGLAGFFVQSIFFRILNKYMKDRNLLLLSFVFGILYNFMYSIAQTKNQIYIASTLSSFIMLSFPIIASLKSILVDVNEQGQIQGALSSINSLSSGFGPILIRYIYNHTMSTFDKTIFGTGSIFLFASILYAFGSLFILFALPSSNLIAANDNDGGTLDDKIDYCSCVYDDDDKKIISQLDSSTLTASTLSSSSSTSQLFEKQHSMIEEGPSLHREFT